MDKGIYKSEEENMMASWLEEAKEHGLVLSWEYEPVKYMLSEKKTQDVVVQMKTKTKVVERHVCSPHTYQPDFQFKLSDEGYRLFGHIFPKTYLTEPTNPLFKLLETVAVDVKGGFMNSGEKKCFSINQKWMFDRYNIWTEYVVPWIAPKKVTKKRKKAVPAKGLFADTFVPDSLRWMNSRKSPTLNTKGVACNTIQEFLEFSREQKKKGKTQ